MRFTGFLRIDRKTADSIPPGPRVVYNTGAMFKATNSVKYPIYEFVTQLVVDDAKRRGMIAYGVISGMSDSAPPSSVRGLSNTSSYGAFVTVQVAGQVEVLAPRPRGMSSGFVHGCYLTPMLRRADPDQGDPVLGVYIGEPRKSGDPRVQAASVLLTPLAPIAQHPNPQLGSGRLELGAAADDVPEDDLTEAEVHNWLTSSGLLPKLELCAEEYTRDEIIAELKEKTAFLPWAPESAARTNKLLRIIMGLL